MLVEFTFRNFNSFKDQASFTLVAASKLKANPKTGSENVVDTHRTPALLLLTSSAIYGANASGKSNFIAAMASFRRCVLQSANIGFKYGVAPYRLDDYSSRAPSMFEITFLMDDSRIRYGYEIEHESSGGVKIAAEWLYRAKGAKESLLFERTGDIVQRGSAGRSYPEGSAILKEGHVRRSDALFLSLVAQIGGEYSTSIVKYIRSGIQVLSGMRVSSLDKNTERYLEDRRYSDQILSIIRELDTGIKDIRVRNDSEGPAPRIEVETADEDSDGESDSDRVTTQPILDSLKLQSKHTVHNSDGEIIGDVELPVLLFESEGTKKLIAYAGPITNTLANGSVLFVDEIDARFHPLVTRALIRLFQSRDTNPRNAQLVFVTHDTNLLSSCNLRRDQIWFVEKDRLGGSHLYSLADFKGVRSDDPFEENYIAGRYGAIPYIGNLNHLLISSKDAELVANAKP